MLVCDRGLVLQLPHQHVDEVGVFDDNRHLLKHALKADAGLLQAGEKGKEKLQNVSIFRVRITN